MNEAAYSKPVSALQSGWRPRPESNRRARICSPLRHHSATWPISGNRASGCFSLYRSESPTTIASVTLRFARHCRTRTAHFLRTAMTDFATARRHMVDGQVRTADVTDLRIISAMMDIPREQFVPARSLRACLPRPRFAGWQRHAPTAQADGIRQADPRGGHCSN